MTAIRLREFWSELLSDERPAGDLRLRLIQSSADVRVFAAVTTPLGLPGVLVDLPQGLKPRDFTPLITRAFQMAAPTLTGLPPGRWGLVIQLSDQDFADLFEILATDVLNAAGGASTGAQALESVLRCVARWRRFVERRGEPLSEEEVRGLIGELVILCRCTRRFGPETALSAWTGPDRALRDFELPDSSVEVKTFQGDDSGTVLISRPDQLDAVAERPVSIAAVRVTSADAQGATLGEFVARAAAVIGGHPLALATLEDKLATAGYLGSHAPLYMKRFVAGPVWTFSVTPAFPRIRSVDIPQGVVNVRFALNLRALAPFGSDAFALIGDRVPEVEAIQ